MPKPSKIKYLTYIQRCKRRLQDKIVVTPSTTVLAEKSTVTTTQ